jgi:hypothetical protein
LQKSCLTQKEYAPHAKQIIRFSPRAYEFSDCCQKPLALIALEEAAVSGMFT